MLSKKVVDLAGFLPEARPGSINRRSGRISRTGRRHAYSTQQLYILVRSVVRAGAAPLFSGFEQLPRGETHRERPKVLLGGGVRSRDGSSDARSASQPSFADCAT